MNKKEFPSISNVWTHRWHRNPILWARDMIEKAKWTKQRKHRGFSDYDVYGLSDYLTSVIKNSINQLAADHYGVPQQFLDKADGDIDKADALYSLYLNAIVENLEIVEREVETVEDVAARDAALHKAFELLEPIYFDLWD
jgi:hypothetical protein